VETTPRSPFSSVPASAAQVCAAPASLPLQPAASGSSLGPSSSLDTSSSLRQHRELVAAAAVEEVVHQIEQNARLAKARLSRKQRQNLRRRRQRAAEAAAAAGNPPADGSAACKGTSRAPVSQARAARKLPSSGQTHEQGCAQPSSSEMLAPPPLHWLHAQRELDAAFQPHVPHRKRMRLVCD
jgi:hypothetical protein